MKRLPLQRRTLAILALVVPLLAAFVFVGLRSGPLAPISVTLATVETASISPALFGIGAVEARYSYQIGPTLPGRLKQLAVHVGDEVKAGQLLGEMEPIDLDDRVRAQDAAVKRGEAMLRETEARQSLAQTQARRYEQLFADKLVSEETHIGRQQELRIANAVHSAAQDDLARARADREAMVAQRRNLRLVAPADGVVAERGAEPGTTVVAGQVVVEIVDPESLWINVRFDQINASGLGADLPARIVLRSRNGQALPGRILRVEPKADVVTEETLAKVIFDDRPEPLPPIGELAEVTVDLDRLQSVAVIPNAAIHLNNGTTGVWQVVDGKPHFVPVKFGAADLNGRVQVLEGLAAGDQLVIYREKALTSRSRIRVVERLPGVSR